MHKSEPFDFHTLLNRFKDEMLPVYVGNPAPIIDYFLWVIEELFNELKLANAERVLMKRANG